jgi:biotin synthase
MINTIDKLYQENTLSKNELLSLLSTISKEDENYLFKKAYETRFKFYQNRVFVRGLIEFSNFCKNPCKYCGISTHNKNITRYRMKKDEIIETAIEGYKLGFKTFVLQGGEDPYFTDLVFIDIISNIKKHCKDAAITLSIGERSKEGYQSFYNAGADRFLLRHETVNHTLYKNLHNHLSLDNRIRCLYDLKNIGYQVGSGFMVGVPGQTLDDLANDLLFLKKLNPHMVGIGPFIPHNETPLKDYPAGSSQMTYRLLALIRLLIPKVLLPSTTALATLKAENRYQGFNVGANVVMPNLTPYKYRKQYQLYNGKKINDTESYIHLADLKQETKEAGFEIDMNRGDCIDWRRKNDY